MNPFTSVPVSKKKRNKFNLSNTQFTNTGFGMLTPTLCLECVPDDEHKIQMAHLIRTQPFNNSTYGQFDVIHDFYKVDWRILTDRKSYDTFFTGGVSGDIKLNFPTFDLYDLIRFVQILAESRSRVDSNVNPLYFYNVFKLDVDPEQRYATYISDEFSEVRHFLLLLDNLGYPVLAESSLTIDGIPVTLPITFLSFDISDKFVMYDGIQYYIIPSINEKCKFNALPYLAYLRVYYDNYIDQNLQSDLFEYMSSIFDSPNFGRSIFDILIADLDNSEIGYQILVHTLYRSFRKDYYSTILPNSQRGNQVSIPLLDVSKGYFSTSDGAELDSISPNSTFMVPEYAGSNSGRLGVENLSGNTSLLDLNLSPIAITAIRTALKLQSWLEKNNIAGSRYFEHILAHFGVSSDDRTLQRSEFLGGSISDLGISIVENQNGDGSTPLGELAGRGTSSNYVNLKSVYCKENSFIIGLTTIMPRPIFTQSLQRFIFKQDKFDLFYPEFQHIGEQEILKREIFFPTFQNISSFSAEVESLEETYGYQQRYGEYKFYPSRVHGSFRGSNSGFVNKFPIIITDNDLSLDKIQCRPEYFKYLFNFSGMQDDTMQCMFQFKISSKRPISFYSMPQLT